VLVLCLLLGHIDAVTVEEGTPCETVFPPVQFPIDIGPHINASFEWWWWLGIMNPTSSSNNKYGLLIMTSANRTCGTTDDSYFTIVSLIDQAANNKYAPFSFNKVIFDLNQNFQISNDLFQFTGSDNTDHNQHLVINTDDFRLDLSLTMVKNDVAEYLPSDNRGAGTSQPRIDIQQGTIMVDNQTISVQGQLRLEHQWSPAIMGVHVHWLWSVFQLSNLFEGTFTIVYDPYGKMFANASWIYLIDPNNINRPLDVNQLEIDYSDPWTSPMSHITYYRTLRFYHPEVGLDITFHTLIDDNEFSLGGASPWYEGMAMIQGMFLGQKVSGQGNIGIMPSS